jgi:hypothetical protein
MDEQQLGTAVQTASEAPLDDRLLVNWLEERPVQSQGQ